ncbi:MAG: hypothetical protein AAGA56_28400 [Myxococcota bacterium]
MRNLTSLLLCLALVACGDDADDESTMGGDGDNTTASGGGDSTADDSGGDADCVPTEGTFSLTGSGATTGSFSSPCVFAGTTGDRTTINFADNEAPSGSNGLGGFFVFNATDLSPLQYAFNNEEVTCAGADLFDEGTLDGTSNFTRNTDSGWTLEMNWTAMCCLRSDENCTTESMVEVSVTGTLSEEASLD